MTFLKTTLSALAILLATSAIAMAQDEDDSFDFGDMDGDDAEFVNDEPVATDLDGTSTPNEGDQDETPVLDPAVNEILLSNPQTPDELLRAVDVLASLDRHDLAKDFLQKLVDLQLDKVSLANLHQRVGSGRFVRLAGTRELNPQAAEFAKSVLAAATEMQQDPKRLARIIDQLESADAGQHRRLARKLITAGPVAVAPMLDRVASQPTGGIAPLLRTSLAAIGQPAVGPLLAFLDSNSGPHRAEAIRILGHMRANQALPFLTRSISSKDDYERKSAQDAITKISGASPGLDDLSALTASIAAKRYEGRITIEVNSDGKSNAWVWSESEKKPIQGQYSPRDIALFEAARHYETLSEIDPSNSDNVLRYLISAADAATVQAGLDAQPPTDSKFLDAALNSQPELVLHAYKVAMTDGHVPAMIGLADALRRISDETSLAFTKGQPSPLATGLAHADPRVRFAAATAVAQIGSNGPFAGNSRLTESLAHFSSSRGRRGALVAHPRAEIAQTIAGLLSQLGFDADIATTSKMLLKHSTDSVDYEFFLISDAFNRPVTHQTVQLLRQNPLTAKKPIAILARSAKHSDAPMIEDLQPNVITLPESREIETISRAVLRLEKLAGQSAVSAERRAEMAYSALSHLAKLAGSSQLSGTDLTRHVHQIKRSCTTRGLAEKSIEVLGTIGNPNAQAILLEIANQHSLPIAYRSKAAEAFEGSVNQFGVMLTRTQVKTQYHVYNGSESLDEPTQQLLGAVLDSIENRLTN